MDGVIKFATDFTVGGVSGAIAKTCTAPIERVKILIQTQDANPRIMSGEIPRSTIKKPLPSIGLQTGEEEGMVSASSLGLS